MSPTRTSSSSPAAGESAAQRTTAVAMLGAGAMIAHQVGGKATRDAFFLSNFDVTSLPVMLMAAAALSIAAVLGTTRLLRRLGPARLVPVLFGSSAVLLVGEWILAWNLPRVVAVVFYLHVTAFGSVLISTFWSLVNECFVSPRVAKRYLGRISAASAFGGLVGGGMAGLAGARFTVTAMLPVLGALHLLCAAVCARLRPTAVQPAEQTGSPHAESEWDRMGGFELLRRSAYLRGLGMLVFLGTTAAALLDYVFKMEASRHYPGGDGLIQFFAVFYSAVAVAAFLLQTGFGRLALERLQLSGTVRTLPVAAGLGGLATLFAPSLITIGIARAAEAVTRSSFFRSGYEIFFNPVPVRQRRSTKTIIDVGFDRVGDVVGGGLIRGLLWLGPQLARSLILALAAALSGLALILIPSLHKLYIRTLARSLRSRAVEIDLEDVDDGTTRSTVLQTIDRLNLPQLAAKVGAAPLREAAPGPTDTGQGKSGAAQVGATVEDPLLDAIAGLRSRDPDQIRDVLRRHPVPGPELVPHLISLMAWNEVAADIVGSLRMAVPRNTGQIVDALLDPDQEFAIRRRLPRVLSAVATDGAVQGLKSGLSDRRFEVRYQCGLALARVHQRHPEIPFAREEVFATVMREVSVERQVWESYRLIDQPEPDEESDFVDELIRDRASRSLEHVFTLLSLVLPRKPLKIAFRGLHTADPALRGTVLEYLELVLPREVRASLWPFVESKPAARHTAAERDAAIDRLFQSNESIQIELERLRREGMNRAAGPERDPTGS